MGKEIGVIGGIGVGLHAAIEACAKSKDAVLMLSNEKGIEIVNVNEINRSPFAPEPTMLIKSYHNDLVAPFIEPTNQKKYRKKNNRKKSKRRK